jgi:enoyl-CoA hydratase/carnithine racemase
MKDIRVEREGRVGLAIIDRPPNNAVGAETLAELCDALDSLETDRSVGAIVLTSAGKHFCAGADFGFLEGLTTTPAVDVRDKVYGFFQVAARRLYRSEKPTLAAVTGAAVTVGCELSLACDFRIAADNAVFQESWIRLGLLPPLGGMFLLPRTIGITRANEMILQGRAVSAEKALNIGLISEIVCADALRSRAITLATELADLPPRAYALAKEGLQRGAESSIDREWAAGVLAQSLLIGAEDFKEGIAAAKAKRKPVYSGR